MSEVTGISRTSIQRILKHYKWHPYKIQLLHELNEDDHDRRQEVANAILLNCTLLACSARVRNLHNTAPREMMKRKRNQNQRATSLTLNPEEHSKIEI
nr:unnamed protein product [Callosobruchus chinensis]